jgi:lycopene beta-cyclase
MNKSNNPDIVIVGGGLSGSLLAWILKQRVPELSVLLLEQGKSLGGNHTWSFFETDLSDDANKLIVPLVSWVWEGNQVRFPAMRRRFGTRYKSIASRHFHAVLSKDLGETIRFNTSVTKLTPSAVTLGSGRTIETPLVIDARGPVATPHLVLGFQKFVGLEVRFSSPHGETVPMIMDATVPQTDGYRFVYTLPFSQDTMLIEDTYYSDHANLPVDELRNRTAHYAAQRGWTVAETLREEHGVLPIILAGDIDRHLSRSMNEPPRIGLAAALFHPTTGYSLPDAVRTANLLADHAARKRPMTSAAIGQIIDDHARALWRERRFFRMLNRLLFRAGDPKERYLILQRFYGFDESLIQRFYGAHLRADDKVRIVTGKPPVSILSALRYVFERSVLEGQKVENEGRA